VHDDLVLSWEASRDPLNGDFDPADDDADEVLARWLQASRVIGGWINLYWSVVAVGRNSSDIAPFAVNHHGADDAGDFLTAYTWPQPAGSLRLCCRCYMCRCSTG
jgi:hypothetical protein